MSTTEKKLTGKVGIVTGASKGIGAAIAKHMAAEGVAVVVNYASSKDGADRAEPSFSRWHDACVAAESKQRVGQ